jgi:hypothetical protein
MYRLFALAAMLAVAFSFAIQAQDKKADKDLKTIEDIMLAAHQGKKSYKSQIDAAVKKNDFVAATKHMDAWSKVAPEVGKLKPPKGTDASWKKLTGEYEKQVKDLATAVKGKKKDDATKVLKAIGSSCTPCHKAHQAE